MNKLILMMFLALTFLSPTEAATFCACCAESGEYSISTGKPSDYDIEVLKGMKFEESAFLYLTEAEFEMVKGLDEVKKEFESGEWTPTTNEFDLVNNFVNKTWTLNFKTKGGKTGRLVLPIPSQMVKFKVDIHDGKTGGSGPLLYKEFRFKGTVQSGTGFFGGGIVKPTNYFLVFQGRGNVCDNSEDFRHWRLEINGRKAQYAFVGKLSSGTSYEDPEEPAP